MPFNVSNYITYSTTSEMYVQFARINNIVKTKIVSCDSKSRVFIAKLTTTYTFICFLVKFLNLIACAHSYRVCVANTSNKRFRVLHFTVNSNIFDSNYTQIDFRHLYLSLLCICLKLRQ